ncbi:MAG: endolytic transglycosylase MltG, partial [Streptosporangiaceae bacterium]
YRMHRHMKASLALALLLKPSSREQTKIIIPEGFRVAQIIERLGKQTGNLKGYEQAIAHPDDLGLPPFADGKPEGYLFPATYEVQPSTSPAAVLKAMATQFKQNAQSIGLPAHSARAQETQGAVITVASLIQAEGKRRQDFPKMAEVIYNRLNMNPKMPLELDTTVLYAMGLAHQSGFNTNFKSPYNTYLHAGLPPGPIDNPGNTAIEAALRPDHGGLLYFLTINSKTGDTLFFTNATAFNAAVQKYGSTGAGTGSRTGSG